PTDGLLRVGGRQALVGFRRFVQLPRLFVEKGKSGIGSRRRLGRYRLAQAALSRREERLTARTDRLSGRSPDLSEARVKHDRRVAGILRQGCLEMAGRFRKVLEAVVQARHVQP